MERVQKAAGFVRKHKGDYVLVLFVAMLGLLGLIVLFAISPALSQSINDSSGGGVTLDQNHFMQRQLLYVAVGVAAFVGMSLVPLDWLRRYRVRLLQVGIGLCVVLAILGLINAPLVTCYGGACRWFDIGPFSLQPAEVLKFAIMVFLAAFMAERIKSGRINDVQTTLVPIGIILMLAIVLIVGIQKDMGTGLSLLGLVMSMLFVSGLRLKYFGFIAMGLAAAMVIFIAIAPHRIERVTTFLTGAAVESEDDSANYHINQATIAIGSGGVIGKNLGNSVQVFGYLPEAKNDSIFAILGEMFGFVGLVAILALFFGLLKRLLRIIDHLVDPYYRLLVAGVFGWVATQTIVNVGAMLAIFPLTGVTLPLISFGGTSLLFIMAVLGLAFQISRYTTHANIGGGADEAGSSRRGLGRTRYAGSRGYQRAR